MPTDRIPIKKYAKNLRKHQTRGELSLKLLKLLFYLPQRPVGGYIPDYFSPIWLVAIEVNGNIHQTRAKKHKDKTKRRSLRRNNRVYTLYISNEDAIKYPHVFFVEVLATGILWRSWVGARRMIKRLMI